MESRLELPIRDMRPAYTEHTPYGVGMRWRRYVFKSGISAGHRVLLSEKALNLQATPSGESHA